jgi:hypothetical protein
VLYVESCLLIPNEARMSQLDEEERQRILESSPVGTFALLAAVIGSMVIAWLFLYFGVFIPRGIIN